MEFIKKKIFVLEISSQLQYGILAVSFSVCFLVFFLITTFSFILANLSYIDVIAVIDKKESDMIDKISDYYANYQMLNEEMSRNSLQWVRNLLNNYKQRKDSFAYLNFNITNSDEERIRNAFIYIDDKNNSIDCSIVKYKCFYYKNYQSSEEIPEYFRFLYYLLPLLNTVAHSRLIGANQSIIFEKFIIHSNELNTTFFYGENLQKESFTEAVESFNDLRYKLFDSYMTNFNNFKNISKDYMIDRINKNFLTNKTLSQIVIKHPGNIILEINNTSQNYSEKNKYTTSFSFQNNYDVQNITVMSNRLINASYEVLDDIITGQWSQGISTLINNDVLTEFSGVDVLLTKTNMTNDMFSNNQTEILLSQEMCEYFQQIQIFKNTDAKKIINFTQLNENSTILDCFYLGQTKTYLQNLMNLNKWLSYKYKRKLKIPLFYNFAKSQADSNYKIVKSPFPDEVNLRLSPQNFLIFNKYNFYFFSVSKYSENIYNIIFFKFVAMMMFLIMINLLLWIIILFIITLLVIKVSHELTTPIKTLIRTLPIMNKLNKNHLMKEIEKIKYEDDSTINEFFQISKEMIIGGFKVKHEKNQIDFYEEVDQISEIRLNNIIICEDQIESDFNKDVKNLFNYVPSYITGQFNSSSRSLCEGSEDVEEFKLNFEDYGNEENFDLEEMNLGLIGDELISNRQRRAVDKIMLKSEYDLISVSNLKTNKKMKTFHDRLYIKKTQLFMNLENIFEENIDRDLIKLVSEFSLNKNKENIFYLYYDKIYSN